MANNLHCGVKYQKIVKKYFLYGPQNFLLRFFEVPLYIINIEKQKQPNNDKGN